MRQRGWILLGGVLLLILIAAHLVYAYHPRPRPRGSNDSPLAALLAEPAYALTLWLPHPHQNLPWLQKELGMDRVALRAAIAFLDLKPPEWTGFGPLPLPPSQDLAIAIDTDGELATIAARIYPLLSFFARLSGSLTDHPGLAGGTIERLNKPPLKVTWHGNLWTVTRDPRFLDLPSAAASPTGAASCLAVLELHQPLSHVPVGRYRLEHRQQGFEILSEEPATRVPALEDRPVVDHDLALLLLANDPNPSQVEAATSLPPMSNLQALALFPTVETDLQEIPRTVVIHSLTATRWPLPGENLLQLTGRLPDEATHGGWQAVAWGASNLERAERLIPVLKAAVAAAPHLRWGLWLDLRAAQSELGRIATMLEQAPLVPRRTVERWRQAETLLSPLAERFSRLTVVITSQPATLRLRLDSPAS